MPAREWFAAQPEASVAFSRITQMGLLRLLTNANVMGRAPRTIAQAWDVFTELRRDRRLLFLTEPDGVESVWRGLMTQGGVGPSSWTDAYLAAFARISGMLAGDLRQWVHPLGRVEPETSCYSREVRRIRRLPTREVTPEVTTLNCARNLRPGGGHDLAAGLPKASAALNARAPSI